MKLQEHPTSRYYHSMEVFTVEPQPLLPAPILNTFTRSMSLLLLGRCQTFQDTSILLRNSQGASTKMKIMNNSGKFRENDAEDDRCLAMAEDVIANSDKTGCPITGVIVEPIQAEGGDHHGSNKWFQGLQKICKKYDIVYLIDEVQTGGGPTGK